jgi:hypothetical protein
VEYRHFAFWPPGLPRSLAPARTTLHACLEATALRFPDKPATIFQDEILTWAEVRRRARALAGYLQVACGVRRGDRVLLDMQNGADWVIACFAILRADAVAVPVAPMNVAAELAHYIEDCDVKVRDRREGGCVAVRRTAARAPDRCRRNPAWQSPAFAIGRAPGRSMPDAVYLGQHRQAERVHAHACHRRCTT